MPGSWINHSQRSLYMTSQLKGDSQERAAARSGFSERSGRRIEKAEGGPDHRKPRRHRTRKDPFASVWEPKRLVPLFLSMPINLIMPAALPMGLHFCICHAISLLLLSLGCFERVL